MNENSQELTRLERLLFDEAFRRYGQFGIPVSSGLSVVNRTFDAAGRYTYVSYAGLVQIVDGIIPLAQAELGSNGLLILANLEIDGGVIHRLHLIVAGDFSWDGNEPEPITLFLD